MEYQFKPWQPVIVRNFDDEIWRPTFYSYQDAGGKKLHYTLGFGWKRQCLPVKGNRHLVGTTDNPTPPEPEFKFGDRVEVSDDNKVFYEAIFICKSVHYGHTYFAIARDCINPTCFKFCRHADW